MDEIGRKDIVSNYVLQISETDAHRRLHKNFVDAVRSLDIKRVVQLSDMGFLEDSAVLDGFVQMPINLKFAVVLQYI